MSRDPGDVIIAIKNEVEKRVYKLVFNHLSSIDLKAIEIQPAVAPTPEGNIAVNSRVSRITKEYNYNNLMPAISYLSESGYLEGRSMLPPDQDQQQPGISQETIIAIAVAVAVTVPSAILLAMYLPEYLLRRKEKREAAKAETESGLELPAKESSDSAITAKT